MALFGQDRPDAGATDLGSVLGDLLTGGPDRRARANEPQRMKQNFDAFDALNQARISRAQANSREALTAEMVTRALTGDQGALGELGATTMRMSSGQPNLSTFTGGVQDITGMEMDRQIQEALASGDVATARRLSAVKNDKVLPELGAGGKAVFAPIDGAVTMTPLGEADIDATRALEGQRRASAASSYASADSTRRRVNIAETQFGLQREGLWNPGGKTSGGGGAYTAPSQASIQRFLGDQGTDSYGNATTAVDPAVLQDFELWRRANPQYRNGEEALAAYNAERKPLGGVHIIDPTMPGSMTIKPPALGEGGAGGSGRPALPGVPQGAIDHLRANPNLRSLFDDKYGAGAAAAVLGR